MPTFAYNLLKVLAKLLLIYPNVKDFISSKMVAVIDINSSSISDVDKKI